MMVSVKTRLNDNSPPSPQPSLVPHNLSLVLKIFVSLCWLYTFQRRVCKLLVLQYHTYIQGSQNLEHILYTQHMVLIPKESEQSGSRVRILLCNLLISFSLWIAVPKCGWYDSISTSVIWAITTIITTDKYIYQSQDNVDQLTFLPLTKKTRVEEGQRSGSSKDPGWFGTGGISQSEIWYLTFWPNIIAGLEP